MKTRAALAWVKEYGPYALLGFAIVAVAVVAWELFFLWMQVDMERRTR